MSVDISANCLHPQKPGAPSKTEQGVLFRMVGTHHDGQLLRIRQAKFTVGSSLGCTLSLRSPHINPLHGLFFRGERGLLFRAMASDTRVNGETISECWLSIGDRLSLGAIDLEVLETGVTVDETASSEPAAAGFPDPSLNSDAGPDSESINDIRLHEHQRIRKLLTELRTTREHLSRALHTEEFEHSESYSDPDLAEMPHTQEINHSSQAESSTEPAEYIQDMTCRSDFTDQNQNVFSVEEPRDQDRPLSNQTSEILSATEPPPTLTPRDQNHSEPVGTSPAEHCFNKDASATSESGFVTSSTTNPGVPEACHTASTMRELPHPPQETGSKLDSQPMETTDGNHSATMEEQTEALLKSAFEDQLDSSETENSCLSSVQVEELDASKNLTSLREVANLSAREAIKGRASSQPPMIGLVAAGASSTAMGAMLAASSIAPLAGVFFVGLGVALFGAAVATRASRIKRVA